MTSSSPFNIQVLSDLHLEIERYGQSSYRFEFPITAPNLALLGDIGWTKDTRLLDWLEHQCSRFDRVFFVAGNHEAYGSTLAESASVLHAFATRMQASPDRGEFIFLDKTRYDVSPTLSILGCTLWAALDPDDLDILSWGLNDFNWIDGFDPAAFDAAHRADRAWLAQELTGIRAEPARRVAVFTHHAPTIDGTADPKYIGGPTNSAFATELAEGELWGPPVALWAFGHTHWTCDFERNAVRVVSNQRGYKEDPDAFDVGKVIELS